LASAQSFGANIGACIPAKVAYNLKTGASKYSLWIQKPLFYNETLTGTPDYLIATRSALGKTVLASPLLLVVEAKKNDFEQGWGQCLAELVAAQKINDDLTLPVYGIVTDGKLWEFGRLVATDFTKNSAGYTIDHPAYLFGALHFVFEVAGEQAPLVQQIAKII
jgi:hypothetical protein